MRLSWWDTLIIVEQRQHFPVKQNLFNLLPGEHLCLPLLRVEQNNLPLISVKQHLVPLLPVEQLVLPLLPVE